MKILKQHNKKKERRKRSEFMYIISTAINERERERERIQVIRCFLTISQKTKDILVLTMVWPWIIIDDKRQLGAACCLVV